MIIPRLYGRLGNQAFQLSAAIAHAKKVSGVWRVPKTTQNMKIWPHYFLHYLHPSRLTSYTTEDVWSENENNEYAEIPIKKSLTLNGFFQSEKYFDLAKEDIENALGFHCAKKEYIAVHVRRGDYVTQFSDKHPPLDLNYYDQATDYFLQAGFDSYKVYSDDIGWCKEKFLSLGCHFEYCTISDPLRAMRDMYNASGFIIANSTFSLFPALLRWDNPPIVAPAESRWYGPGNSHLSTKHLMPDRFIKI